VRLAVCCCSSKPGARNGAVPDTPSRHWCEPCRLVGAAGLADGTPLDPEQLMALEPPDGPVTLHCEASVAVDLPAKYITLLLSLEGPGAGEGAAVPVGAPVSQRACACYAAQGLDSCRAACSGPPAPPPGRPRAAGMPWCRSGRAASPWAARSSGWLPATHAAAPLNLTPAAAARRCSTCRPSACS
jgi:hypothetical protein